MAQKFSITTLLLFLSLTILSQSSNINSLLKQAKQLDQSANEEGALEKYLEVLKLDPSNYIATWNVSFLYSIIGNRQTDNDMKKEYFNSAKKYGQMALLLNSTDAESNYVMAVAMGRMALISPPKDKVAASRDIKNYADLAITYNPNHSGAYHVLGKWNYEVANLNWAEQAAAKYLFGGIPDGSLDDAISNYLKAIELDPDYILYYLDLAYALEDASQKTQAINILNKALTLSSKTEDDPTYLQQCRDLLAKLQK